MLHNYHNYKLCDEEDIYEFNAMKDDLRSKIISTSQQSSTLLNIPILKVV
jgi:hypothetical protein